MPIPMFVGKGFTQLLSYPITSRMLGNAQVQDAPTVMTNDKEAIEQPECNRRHGKEIHGCNGLAMILKKGLPALCVFWIAWRSFRPTRHRSFGYIKSQFEQFAMDTRSTPGGILGYHAEDQLASLFVDSLPSSSRTRFR